MDSQETKFGLARFKKSFGYAWQGIRLVWSSEQNFRIHTAAAVLVIALGIFLSISAFEWIILVSLIFGMLALETMNTAIEKAVDLVTSEYHPLAKASKDMSSAAVLLYAIGSFIIGCIIFIPKILN
ncbi:diacylglycerol kinase family protein [Bacillus haikouensis]|uniref:diacylglycerol kinase family protein n=1 Tax=Bacillus haikouensis TaxID=1510468 RepID=UPI00155640FD|nr:diacylglycerol kinase family protein [Bacillus haikouensis]NQD66851.1 diacylglycerol kinase family protein [Bacillus haikouensis]